VDAAVAAGVRIRETGRAEAPYLDTIVTAVRAESARNRFRAAATLAGLTNDFPEARDAVRKMAMAGDWHLRRRALRCVGWDCPRLFAAEILRTALLDDHESVRVKAASLACFLQLTELAEDLARYHSLFPAESRDLAAFYLPILRDGYLLEDFGGDKLVLRVFKARGVASLQVTPAELAERGIPAIAAEMRGGA
jgi:hypothetical protein